MRYSYSASLDHYIWGNIVSSTSLRFITNLLAATATARAEGSDDSSGDSEAEAWNNLDLRAGDMDLVHRTLQGMASRSADEGVKATVRHARTIRLGRNLWESPPLESDVTRLIK